MCIRDRPTLLLLTSWPTAALSSFRPLDLFSIAEEHGVLLLAVPDLAGLAVVVCDGLLAGCAHVLVTEALGLVAVLALGLAAATPAATATFPHNPGHGQGEHTNQKDGGTTHNELKKEIA